MSAVLYFGFGHFVCRAVKGAKEAVEDAAHSHAAGSMPGKHTGGLHCDVWPNLQYHTVLVVCYSTLQYCALLDDARVPLLCGRST